MNGNANVTVKNVNKKEILNLEKTIDKLKSSELSIEDQIGLYKDALSKITKTKQSIDSLKTPLKFLIRTIFPMNSTFKHLQMNYYHPLKKTKSIRVICV